MSIKAVQRFADFSSRLQSRNPRDTLEGVTWPQGWEHTFTAISTDAHLKLSLAWNQNHKAACKALYDCSLRRLPSLRMRFNKNVQIIDHAKMRYMHAYTCFLAFSRVAQGYLHSYLSPVVFSVLVFKRISEQWWRIEPGVIKHWPAMMRLIGF